MSGGDRPFLFVWLEHFAVAVGHGKVKTAAPDRAVAVALFLAVWSEGTTGQRAVIRDARLATELGVSSRTIWRDVADLVELGWLQKTQGSTRGRNGQKGRKARYRLAVPRLDLSLGSLPDQLTSADADPLVWAAAQAESFDTLVVNHLTSGAKSSDSDGRRDGVVVPTDGYPSYGLPDGTSLADLLQTAREADAREQAQ